MTPCIVDHRKPDRHGYVRIRRNGKTIGVHRAVWEEANGPIPDGMGVLHHCDNPPCKNLDHLFLGTQKDNMRDMEEKGRGRKAHGEDHFRAILSDSQVINLREIYADGGWTQQEIADLYGVSIHSVSLYIRKLVRV